jgi:membrane protein
MLGKARQTLGRGLHLGWQVLRSAVRDVFTDNIPYWASAVAFNALLSLFPLALLGLSLAASVVDQAWAVRQLHDLLAGVLPLSAGLVEDVVREAIAARESVSIVSLLVLLWSGSRVFGALTLALNVAYDVDESPGWFWRLALQVLMTLTLGLLLLLAVGANVTLAWLGRVLPDGGNDVGLWLLRFVAPITLLLGAFFLVYRFVPGGRRDTRSALVGALAATAIFRLARPLFVFFIQRFVDYNLVYGSLAVVILLLVWSWVVSFIILFGGELAAHTRMLVLEGRSEEEVQRAHQARALSRPTPPGSELPEPQP